ncbi:hypothetical protein C8F01DRAFT_1086317 [Mycena amicta]|nr:hypothetical protein C8F01DRAFT_1086317 [Mycena amicta]
MTSSCCQWLGVVDDVTQVVGPSCHRAEERRPGGCDVFKRWTASRDGRARKEDHDCGDDSEVAGKQDHTMIVGPNCKVTLDSGGQQCRAPSRYYVNLEVFRYVLWCSLLHGAYHSWESIIQSTPYISLCPRNSLAARWTFATNIHFLAKIIAAVAAREGFLTPTSQGGTAFSPQSSQSTFPLNRLAHAPAWQELSLAKPFSYDEDNAVLFASPSSFWAAQLYLDSICTLRAGLVESNSGVRELLAQSFATILAFMPLLDAAPPSKPLRFRFYQVLHLDDDESPTNGEEHSFNINQKQLLDCFHLNPTPVRPGNARESCFKLSMSLDVRGATINTR